MNKRHYITKLFSGLLNILTCLIATTVILFQQDWFGSGDTNSFIFWTIPIAVGLAISGETILNLFRTLHFSLRLLLIIVTAGLVSIGWVYLIYLILGGMINAFSIPIFYLWIGGCFVQLLFLDWRLPKPAEKQKLSKVILSLFAFPLTLIVVVIAMYFFSVASSYLTRPEKETFLIPQNYRGEIYIIYNQKNCEPKEYENKRRVYRIPENGILLTQFKDEYGIIDQEYFFVDKAGNRTKIKSQDSHLFNEEYTSVKNEHEPSRDSVAIFGLSVGSMGGANSNSSDDSTAIKYSNTFVGTYNQLRKSEDRLSYATVDSIRTEYLKNKRN